MKLRIPPALFLLAVLLFLGKTPEVSAKPVSIPVTYEWEGKPYRGLATFTEQRPGELKIEVSDRGKILSQWVPCDTAALLQEIYFRPAGRWRLFSQFKDTPVLYSLYFESPTPTVHLNPDRSIDKITIEGARISQPGWSSQKRLVLGKDIVERAEPGRTDRRMVVFDSNAKPQALLYAGVDIYGRQLAVNPLDAKPFRDGKLASLPLYSLEGKEWRFTTMTAHVKALSPGWPAEALEPMRSGSIPRAEISDVSLKVFMDGVSAWLKNPARSFPKNTNCTDVTGLIPPNGFDPIIN